MMKAWLFPGQGSQYPGMGRWVWSDHSSAQKILAMAELSSGLPLRDTMRIGPSERLMRSDVAEPAITALAIAYVVLLREQGMRPGVVAGYSLGEIAAMFAAGVIELEEALEIATLRGQLLQSAAERGRWRMIVANGLPSGYETGAGTAIAAWNGPSDVTITGEESSVRREEILLIRAGARVGEVSVCGPWHSSLAGEVANALEAKLGGFHFRAPEVPVFLGSTGKCESRPEELRRSLSLQIAVPVLWTGVLDGLWTCGVRESLEVGPGRTLTGFLRRNWSGRAYSAAFLERENGSRSNTLSRKMQAPTQGAAGVDSGILWNRLEFNGGNGSDQGEAHV